MSKELVGVPAAPGAVAGTAKQMAEPIIDLGPLSPPDDLEAEKDAARDALSEVATLLEKRSVAAPNQDVADILSAQAMMAADPVLGDSVATAIQGGLPAAHAVADAFASFKEALVAAGGYMAERAADLDDVSARVVATLLGRPMPGLPESPEPYVLVAKDLAPADTAQLDPALVVALVTREGGPTSHTAIIARSYGIPAVVACARADEIGDGESVVVDGDRGVVVRSPDDALLAEIERRAEWFATVVRDSHGPGRTSDGHTVPLLANIGNTTEAESAAADCEGVGLFRTEFLFLDRVEEPSVAEQTDVYTAVFKALGGRKVVLRTLDAGADKPLVWLDLGKEMNPALGIRGLRTARVRPDVLERQLVAVQQAAEASATEVWVMAPMVSTVAEAAEFVASAHDAGLPRAGVMVEVPALALDAREVATVVDFFSIGSNDLTQYVSAADRTVGALSDLLDHWQPPVVRLIREVAEGGNAAGVPVGVCGESASDPLFALVLVGLGISTLSMSAAALPLVRASLAAHSLEECQAMATRATDAIDAANARTSVLTQSHVPVG